MLWAWLPATDEPATLPPSGIPELPCRMASDVVPLGTTLTVTGVTLEPTNVSSTSIVPETRVRRPLLLPSPMERSWAMAATGSGAKRRGPAACLVAAPGCCDSFRLTCSGPVAPAAAGPAEGVCVGTGAAPPAAMVATSTFPSRTGNPAEEVASWAAGVVVVVGLDGRRTGAAIGASADSGTDGRLAAATPPTAACCAGKPPAPP